MWRVLQILSMFLLIVLFFLVSRSSLASGVYPISGDDGIVPLSPSARLKNVEKENALLKHQLRTAEGSRQLLESRLAQFNQMTAAPAEDVNQLNTHLAKSLEDSTAIVEGYYELLKKQESHIKALAAQIEALKKQQTLQALSLGEIWKSYIIIALGEEAWKKISLAVITANAARIAQSTPSQAV